MHAATSRCSSARQRLPQPLADRRLPLLELRAVAQREAGQEVVPVQPDRALQRRGVRPRPISVSKSPHVDPDRRRARSATAARLIDQPVAHRGGGDRKRAPQRARALALSASGHSRSASCSRLCSRPVTPSSGEQGDRLPGVEGDRRAVALHDRRPQQRQAQFIVPSRLTVTQSA